MCQTVPPSADLDNDQKLAVFIAILLMGKMRLHSI